MVEEIITEGPFHVYCSEQFNLFNFHGKVQSEVANE